MAGQGGDRPLRLRFHAVTVVAGPNACAQAHALKDVRLLSVEAPRLPMANCDHPDQCDCRFKHHDDRRAGPRRSLERSGSRQDWLEAERRIGRGRRSTDDLD